MYVYLYLYKFVKDQDSYVDIEKLINIYLLLAECEVRTASYGPSFFLPFMA